MAINLEKGQRINLEKADGSKLVNFCVGCNWGAIVKPRSGLFGAIMGGNTATAVDLDLSCVLIDGDGNACDHIYSPLYKKEFLSKYGLPEGKLDAQGGALHHSGDDLEGDKGGDDGLDNEIITVDLSRVDQQVQQIFFFLNNVGKEDFSQIPYASIRMYEGTPKKVNQIFATYNVASDPQFVGKHALIMGKLYRHNGAWKFNAIGDAFEDSNFAITFGRIVQDYAKR